MKPWLRFALTGLAAYLVFLVVTLPAAPLVSRLASADTGLRIAGVSGTLWSGEAVALDTGTLNLRDVEWHLQPLALFTGTLKFALAGSLGTETVRAHAGVNLWGTQRLTRVQGRLPLGEVLQRLDVPAEAGVAGMLEFDLDEVRWTDAALPLVDGNLVWKPALMVAPVELDFGTASLKMRIEDDRTLGDLNASGGQLLVQGKVEMQPDGAYRLDAELRTNGDVPGQVGDFLSTFTEYRNGVYRLEWSDQL